MKLSISLSDTASEQLKSLVTARDSNASAVLEASLLTFAMMPKEDQERELRHLQNLRKAGTRDGWMHVFWDAVAEEFGTKDFDWTGQDNPLTPRTHGGFRIVFLYDERSPMAGPIDVHAFQNEPSPDGRSTINYWKFDKGQSVYGAAHQVANWIREHPQRT